MPIKVGRLPRFSCNYKKCQVIVNSFFVNNGISDHRVCSCVLLLVFSVLSSSHVCYFVILLELLLSGNCCLEAICGVCSRYIPSDRRLLSSAVGFSVFCRPTLEIFHLNVCAVKLVDDAFLSVSLLDVISTFPFCCLVRYLSWRPSKPSGNCLEKENT